MTTPADAQARIKGVVLIARLRWLRERGGEQAVHRVVGRLLPDEQALLRGPLLHGSWYPQELKMHLDEAAADELSPGDRRQGFRAMGRASAEINFAGPHKPYLQPGNPHGLLSRTPQIYRAYHEVGRREYEGTGPSTALIRTHEARVVTANDCQTVCGWLERAIELCGAKSVRVVEVQCRVRGAAYCEYKCQWALEPAGGRPD